MIPFGEAVAVFVGEQFVVVIGGGRQPEKLLEDHVQVSRGKQIDAADNVGDSLQSVIEDDGEVVAGPDVFADDDGVTEEFGLCQLFPGGGVGPVERAGGFQCLRQIETQGVGLAVIDTSCPLGGTEASAGSGINRAVAAVGGLTGRFDFALDVFPRAEAGVEKAFAVQFIGRVPVFFEMLALDAHRLLPFNPEPGEIFEDLAGVVAAAAMKVDVFDPEQKTSAPLFREAEGLQRRVGVTGVEVPGRTGSKS